MTRIDSGAGSTDELGAHVSTAGVVARAPARGREIEAGVIQVFTKQPSRWAEPPRRRRPPAGQGDRRRSIF